MGRAEAPGFLPNQPPLLMEEVSPRLSHRGGRPLVAGGHRKFARPAGSGRRAHVIEGDGMPERSRCTSSSTWPPAGHGFERDVLLGAARGCCMNR